MAENERRNDDADSLYREEVTKGTADDASIAAGQAAGAATGASTSGAGSSVGSLGAAVLGSMAADDLVDRGGQPAEPDRESSADSYAGGDSSGADTVLSDEDQPR
jgi:hypothetical protein